MEKAISVYSSFDEMKATELRDWQSLPVYERLGAASELTLALYGVKEANEDVRRIQRSLVPASTKQALDTSSLADTQCRCMLSRDRRKTSISSWHPTGGH